MVKLQVFLALFTSNLVFTQSIIGDNDLIVHLPGGKIQGSILKTRLGKDIQSFRGIRYAKPPVGNLRFQPPVPIVNWEGIYNATEDGPACPQPNIRPISEDCLMLNVYTTKLQKNSNGPNRPVIVFFHPGGFYSYTARSNWFGPEYFLDQDIVLVTVNYRLGSLGFLSTGDKLSPGNNGLKDQVLALKWVQKNIETFGGNPNSVTISGCSAGAASVTLHMVSPMSKGLFHRAISMSGSILGNWPIKRDLFDLAQKQARFVNCPDDTSEKIIDCLKTKSAEEIADSLSEFVEWGWDPILIWNAVIEGDFDQGRFLIEHPIKSILQGRFEKVPFMTGVTADEFARSAYPVINNSTWLQEMDSKYLEIFPISFIYERDTENSRSISRDLRKFYFGSAPMDNNSLTPLGQLYADALIGFGVHRAANLISKNCNQNIYYYRFSFKGRFSYFWIPGTTTPYPGVSHQDDLIYLYYNQRMFPEFNQTDSEYRMVQKLTLLQANFAKTGNPTPDSDKLLNHIEWIPFTSGNSKYLDIGETLVIKENLYENRYDEWDELFPISTF